MTFADETNRYVPSNGPPAVEGDGVCATAAASKPKNPTIHSNPIRFRMGVPSLIRGSRPQRREREPRARREPTSGGRPRSSAAKPAGDKRSSPSLSGQVLALASGKTQQEIGAACKEARPNHVGAAISRPKRAGRIEERDRKLYATQSRGDGATPAI